MTKIISAFQPVSAELAARRLATIGTPEAYKFYHTMSPKTAWAMMWAERAQREHGRDQDKSWNIATKNGIIPE